MSEISLKLQIDSIEQQLKILKSKMANPSPKKTLSELYGILEGQADMSIEEIRNYEYLPPSTFLCPL